MIELEQGNPRASTSILLTRIKRTGQILRDSASHQIKDYNSRFKAVNTFYEKLFENLLVQDFDQERACETALAFFGSNKVNFAAVDGTEYSKPMFDLVVFFGGSYAAEGTITISRKGVEVSYKTRHIENGFGISSCVPIYVHKIPEIDQVFMDISEPGQVNLRKPLTEEVIINNASISNWIMTFSEFYLAYKLAKDPERSVRILLLDRNLSNMHSSLMYDTSRRKLWQTNCTIYGLEVEGLPIDVNDLAYGRHRLINNSLGVPPARGDYLRYKVIYLIEEKGPLTEDEIFAALNLDEGGKIRALKYLKKSVEEGYLIPEDRTYRLNPRYRNVWARLRALVESVGRQLFEEQTDTPLMIRKGDELQWLTTLDLAFLSLFCLYMLVEECWNRNVLLLAMTKDTSARDFKNHVLPVCINNRILETDLTQEELDKVPNTDRMMLQSISLFNSDKTKVPWSLIEYDAAFIMIVPDFKKRLGFVSGAVKNKITPSKLFLKSYVQLAQASHDSLLRSNVLAMDRPVYPGFDLKPECLITFKHEYGSAIEPVEVVLYRDKKMPNDLQNLSILILKAMTCPSIPEAFGYNKPLFIADKVAKWHNEEFRKIVNSTAHWIVTNHDLRQFVFYMSTFRERRSEIESTRRYG